MPRFDAFTGPFNTPFSANIQSELTMNWIPERNAVSVNDMGTDVTDKNVRCSLIRTPGIHTFTTLPKTPVRGVFPGEFRLFAAAGNSFYEVFSDGTFVDRSVPGFTGASGVGPAGTTIGNDGLPVTAFFNGNQVLLISAGKAFCDSGNGPVACQFSDPLTDLLVDPTHTDGKTLTTPIGGLFDQSDVGKTVRITGGAGFNLISQVILSVDASGGAVGASAWGIPGSGLGTGMLLLGSISYTDLQLVTPFIAHSPSRIFGPSEIGTQLTITSGTGWTPGTYTISGLVYDITGTPTGDAVLFPNAGSAGATGGTGTIAAMMVTASSGAFLDGYFFTTPYPRTKTVYYSTINDGRLWDPLDFFVKTYYPDNIATLWTDHEELYAFGLQEMTQIYRDVGDLDNPFRPDPGSVMHLACIAPFSVCRFGEGLAWLGGDVRRGSRRAYAATGYRPTPISTPGVEAQWALYTNVSDAVAFPYTDQGHELWLITFPSANATWAYDLTTGWWHQWGYWDETIEWWDRIRPWVHCVVALGGGREQHYGGDWQNGKIYIISRDYKTDDGWTVVRRRLAPHMTKENMRRFYARFEIDCDVLGQQRIFWNRLGYGRDRIWLLDAIQTSETGGVSLTLGFSDDRANTFHRMSPQALDPTVDVSIANAYLNYTDATWH